MHIYSQLLCCAVYTVFGSTFSGRSLTLANCLWVSGMWLYHLSGWVVGSWEGSAQWLPAQHQHPKVSSAWRWYIHHSSKYASEQNVCATRVCKSFAVPARGRGAWLLFGSRWTKWPSWLHVGYRRWSCTGRFVQLSFCHWTCYQKMLLVTLILQVIKNCTYKCMQFHAKIQSQYIAMDFHTKTIIITFHLIEYYR